MLTSLERQQSGKAVQHPNPAIQKLLSLEPLKTWSLIVTVFGDFDGDALTGAQIRAFLAPLGIKPEAIRVALHRLKTDGWITSSKSGREALYQLSRQGRDETEAVRADVYGGGDKYPLGWSLLVVQDTSEHESAISIGRNAILVPNTAMRAKSDALVLPLADVVVPGWVEDCLVPARQRQNMDVLARVLKTAEADQMSATDLAALRILTLHHWRRQALRIGSWAHLGILKTGTIARCRSIVIEFLENSDRLSL